MKVLVVAEGDIDAGAHAERRKAFVDLWTDLVRMLCPDAEVRVQGFNMSAIINLDRPAAVKANLNRAAIPLDQVVRSAWLGFKPEVTIIAFDRWPTNQLLPPDDACRPGEVAFVLERLIANAILPTPLIKAAKKLHAYYQQPRKQRRWRGALEIICMEPEFEALPASDEAAVRRALGFSTKPKDWPWNATRAAEDPKGVLADCVKLTAPPKFKRPARGDFLSNPHGWAHAFIQAAKANGKTSMMFSHPLATRLRHKAC